MVFSLSANSTSSRTKSNDESRDIINVSLTKIEQFNQEFGMAPITTLDWLEGNYQTAAVGLQSKLEDILNQNPWLSGRYLGKDSFEYSLTNRMFDVKDMLVALDPCASPIDRNNSTYERLVKVAQRKDLGLVLVAKNYEKQPFLKVAVVPDSQSPETHFVLYVSLSHGIGDGCTFYNIYNMLLGGQPVRAMTPERISTTQEQQEEAMGKAEANLSHSPGLIFAVIRGLLKIKLSVNRKKARREHRILMVDNNKVREIKQRYKEETATEGNFISTNDIITSWLLVNSGCAHGIMAMNLRGRLKGHTKDHAFNAENDVYMRCPQDVATPALIRKTAQTMKRAATADQPVGPWSMAKKSGLCLSTNWAAFKSDEINLLGCDDTMKHLVHMPAYDMEETLTPDMVVGVIFKPRNGQLAVLLGGTADKLKGLSNAAAFESESPFQMFSE